MWKFELKKLAVVTLALTVGFMMACSSSSSSSNDALTHPGNNYLGSAAVHVDPGNETVEIVPTGNTAAGQRLCDIPGMVCDGIGNISNVVLANGPISPSWDGAGLDFSITLKWTDANSSLANVRMNVIASDYGAVSAEGEVDSGGFTLWTDPGLVPGGGTTEVSYTYVSDVEAEGPVTTTTCNQGATCSSSPITGIAESCGAVTANYRFANDGTPYTFYLDLWGDIIPSDTLENNAYFDTNVVSVYLRTWTHTHVAPYPAETTQQTSFAQNDWFYAHYYVDYPGEGRVTGPATTAVALQQIEDTHNRNCEATGCGLAAPSSAQYWYVGRINQWSIRWDPAVVNVNASDTGGGLKFTSAGGTKFFTLDDTDLGAVDGFNVRGAGAAYTTSNSMGAFLGDTGLGAWTSVGSVYPYTGDGVNGFPGDWDVGKIALQPIGGGSSTPLDLSDDGSPIKIAYSTHTWFFGYTTFYTPYSVLDDGGFSMPRSGSWPAWCEKLPGSGCATGQYNAERHQICIQ